MASINSSPPHEDIGKKVHCKGKFGTNGRRASVWVPENFGYGSPGMSVHIYQRVRWLLAGAKGVPSKDRTLLPIIFFN